VNKKMPKKQKQDLEARLVQAEMSDREREIHMEKADALARLESGAAEGVLKKAEYLENAGLYHEALAAYEEVRLAAGTDNALRIAKGFGYEDKVKELHLRKADEIYSIEPNAREGNKKAGKYLEEQGLPEEAKAYYKAGQFIDEQIRIAHELGQAEEERALHIKKAESMIDAGNARQGYKAAGKYLENQGLIQDAAEFYRNGRWFDDEIRIIKSWKKEENKLK
jgi:hypothetical protein